MKRVFNNILALFISLISILLVLEFIVFRIVFVASELPMLATGQTQPLKFMPNQTGYYRVRDEIKAVYQINADGWNSGVKDYQTTKKSKNNRIAIIGDSYVEAFQVNYWNSFAERMKNYLGESVEQVYRFGLSGAPLSHYLHMLKEEVVVYKPDVVIVNMVHNDFHESLVSTSATYSESLARLKYDQTDQLSLTNPVAYDRKPHWWIKRSAIFRYLWVRQQIRPATLKKLFIQTFEKTMGKTNYVANVNLQTLSQNKIAAAVDYIFGELANFEDDHGITIILVLDADRGSITDAVDSGEKMVSDLDWLHRVVSNLAQKHSLLFLDLTDSFMEDYKQNRIAFSFLYDGHWNEYTHGLVARTLIQKYRDVLVR